MPVVEVEDLQKSYGKVVAVDGISFTVGRGEIFGIVGPNGAGKSTTVECLAGLREKDGGTVRVLGLDPLRDGRKLRQRIGVQLQQAALPDDIKVWEALDLYASFYRDPADWERLLEQWGLEEKRDTRFKNLSGGQKQRLFIALALVNRPEVVFLDEITTGLDPQARRLTWDLVREIRARGATVLLVTHSMEEAEKLCDRVAIIEGGHIVALDSPEVLVQEGNPESSVLLAGIEGFDPSALQELEGVSRTEWDGGQLVVYGGGALLPRVIVALDHHGITPSEVTVGRRTLEDVFVEKTGRRIRD
ncbi:MAG: ABC transporter ATP-binding protein [Rubrobacter sp.]|nr:ABC transporter ATP-binding protein [Rubrobacter sp.]